jgi:hypothetical protein
MRVLPDGFWPLLAPGAALPALLPVPPVVEVPVVVVPFMEEPVVVPLAADPPAAELPPAEPLPLWASANVLVSASAANPIVMSLMFSSSLLFFSKGQAARRSSVPICLVMAGSRSGLTFGLRLRQPRHGRTRWRAQRRAGSRSLYANPHQRPFLEWARGNLENITQFCALSPDATGEGSHSPLS